MTKKRMLITGGTGFMGRHARRFFGDTHTIDWCDISVGTDCRDVFKTDIRYDIVLHFAAHVGGRAAIDGDPLSVAQTTILDIEMFRWAERTKPGLIVYPSSSAAYPVRIQQRDFHRPLRESDIDLDMPELPDAAYGWVKLTGEQLARRYSGDVAIIRPMSGYAEDQDGTYPFGAFRNRILSVENPFEIWGDGTQVRDWVHVVDVMRTIDAIIENRYVGAVNIGTGIPTNFLTLANMFMFAAGSRVPIETKPDAPTGVHWRVADTLNMNQLHVATIGIGPVLQRMFSQ